MKLTLHSLQDTRWGMQITWLFILWQQGFTMFITMVAAKYIEIQFLFFYCCILRWSWNFSPVVTIDLIAPHFKPEKKNYQRVLRSFSEFLDLQFDFLITWLPNGECPPADFYQITRLLRYPEASAQTSISRKFMYTSSHLLAFLWEQNMLTQLQRSCTCS